MRGLKNMFQNGLCLALLALASLPVGATTLIRAGVEDLVTANARIVVGEVVDAQSYWNSEGNFILTDVTFETVETIKGESSETLTVTLMGGSVGDLSTLILGGPELNPGQSYLLFLNNEDLPGAIDTLTVRDLCQGAYNINLKKDGSLVAVSQANHHPVLPDRSGKSEAPGGIDGLPLTTFIEALQETVSRLAEQEEASR